VALRARKARDDLDFVDVEETRKCTLSEKFRPQGTRLLFFFSRYDHVMLRGAGHVLATVAIAGFAAAVACSSSGGSAPPEDDAGAPTLGSSGVAGFPADASLAAQARYVLGGCTGGPEAACHGPDVRSANLQLPDTIPSNLVDVASTEEPSLARVRPGDPEHSYLYLKLTGAPEIDGGRMPKDRDRRALAPARRRVPLSRELAYECPMKKALLVGALSSALAIAGTADAFCGFYVSGADAKLFNNATQVVLMRDGTRTVLSMANNYQGPPSSFAMVVPVPVVLQKENVKTLSKEIFAHVDQLGAPRLVEYWEQDPCEHLKYKGHGLAGIGGGTGAGGAGAPETKKDLGVKIEAQFSVGEYDVVVLSAKDSGGLDTWLKQESYKIPDGSEPYLRPYVQAGSKFFVAKVDVTKVKFENGMAQLSPLRFHYDADTFSLPIRLGLMNSNGTQDLIVNILARGQRYEVSNYPNTTIPTNFDVAEPARGQFGSFYAALFDKTMEKLPKAIVTEYSWDAGSCDPCPSPPLTPAEIASLGGDVLPTPMTTDNPRRFRGGSGFTLTRMHARYAKDSLGEDLVFRAAGPITGGREVRDGKGALEHGAITASSNNFQGRYAIRHPWAGAITCKDPIRGNWGGPPNGKDPPSIKPAVDTAFAPRGKLQLATFVKGSLPDVVALPGAVTPLGSPVVPVPPTLDVTPADAGSPPPLPIPDGGSADASPASPPPVTPPPAGCGCDVPGADGSSISLAAGGALLASIALTLLRRRARASSA
jgi:hypothetical protein